MRVTIKWVKILNKDGTKNLPKDEHKRVLIFSPCYEKGDSERLRWVDAQFVYILTNATHWAVVPEPIIREPKEYDK